MDRGGLARAHKHGSTPCGSACRYAVPAQGPFVARLTGAEQQPAAVPGHPREQTEP